MDVGGVFPAAEAASATVMRQSRECQADASPNSRGGQRLR